MDTIAQRVASRFAAEVRAGEGEDSKSLEGAKEYLERVLTLATKAKEELDTKKDPGVAMSRFVGVLLGYRHENWYEHWYR